MPATQQRDHGGGVDAAARAFGGARCDWLDLSTGINPVPFAVPPLDTTGWTALPDSNAQTALITAARRFWDVPPEAGILAVPGASAAIAQMPRLADPARVWIPAPTYNEHAASFVAEGWQVTPDPGEVQASVLVNPNNPDGRLWGAGDAQGALRIIDESFCDVTPEATLMEEAPRPGTLILKSFGKFWGLAGLRLGFVIGDLVLIHRLAQMLGPWPVSGPALQIGTAALKDPAWAAETRARLARDARTLDGVLKTAGATPLGGTSLFRLYDVGNAKGMQTQLARAQIWSRVFPYNARWLRLGLPDATGWARLSKALA